MSNPQQNDEAFVLAAYGLLLGRAPDAAGMAGILAALRSGASRADSLVAIVQSDEFLSRLASFRTSSPSQTAGPLDDATFVEAAYRELLNREPDADGLTGATAHLANGGARSDLLYAIVGSDEFENRLLVSNKISPLPSLVAMRPHRYRRSGEFLGFIVESNEDYDWLEKMIIEHGYYERPSPWGYGFDQDKKNLAGLISLLRPHRVLEVGCGDGGTLHGLRQLGIDCIGLDVSTYAKERALPDIRDRVTVGDLLNHGHAFHEVDTLCGFDIFEHLNPNKFPEYLRTCAKILPVDGLLLINVPAFGDDALFGNAMGVWTDEWRKDLGRHTPFSFIPCDDHGFPLVGHLVWADSVWWEDTFKANGFVRARSIERLLHERYDPIFEYSHARRAFMLFAKTLDDERQKQLLRYLALRDDQSCERQSEKTATKL